MHPLLKAALACTIAAVLLIVPRSSMSQAPTVTILPVTTSTVLTTTTTTTTTSIPHDARCGQWWSLAREVGFTDSMLPTLDRIMYRESRCGLGSMYNAADPNGGSHGLTQVNGFWCQPSRYYPLGYLQTHGVLTSCADLYDPEIALRASLVLVQYSRSVGLCGWAQWAWLDPCEDQ